MDLLTAWPTRSIAQRIVDYGIAGPGPLDSAAELAEEIEQKIANSRALGNTLTPVEAINELITEQSRLGFVGGFFTGLGGLATLPIALPGSIAINWMVQARLVAAIAIALDHDIQANEVRQQITAVLTGDAGVDKPDNSKLGRSLNIGALAQLPVDTAKWIGANLRDRLVKKGMAQGTRLLGPRFVPLLGGAIAGRVDAKACRETGQRALNAFKPAI